MFDKKNDKPVKQLTPKERETAIQFLEGKNLLKRTNELIGRSGVIGEEVNRLLNVFNLHSGKREHLLHIISLESSGADKIHLQEKVGELMPTGILSTAFETLKRLFHEQKI